jgi:AraC family transcriptional regulator of adaptative response/methylated-DNA-[protein]-cysteine methyltransferase
MEKCMRREKYHRDRQLAFMSSRFVHGEILRYDFAQTSIAALLVALSERGVAAISMREHADHEQQLAALRRRFPRAELRYDPAAVQRTIGLLVEFVEEPRESLRLPLDIRGTEFQRRVWSAVLKIPFGTTTTFAKVAREVGAARAMRAVGNACSQNPLEFAIPCHRVLRSDGSYSGGSQWGDHRQATIVQREATWLARTRSNAKSSRMRRP